MALAYSETFEALSEGFQGALWELGAVPAEHRTDNLSAATHELLESRGPSFTERYLELVVVYVLELPSTSAENLFTLEEQAQRDGADLIDRTVRLTVIDRGHWGEVAFERVAHPPRAR